MSLPLTIREKKDPRKVDGDTSVLVVVPPPLAAAQRG